MIAPTYRLIALSAASIPLAVAVLAIDSALWAIPLAYSVALLVLTVVDARSGLLASIVQYEIESPGTLHIGDSAPLTIHFQAGRRGAGKVVDVAIDTNEIVDAKASQSVDLDDQGVGVVSFTLKPARRGILKIERLWLRWLGQFGLVWHSRRDAVSISERIIPNIAAVKGSALTITQYADSDGTKQHDDFGASAEFDALRDYQAGMDYRSIDWKHTARHRKLVSKEFRSERNHNVVLAFDTGQLMREPIDGIPRLDHVINAGLRLAYQALKEGDKVGFLAFDSTVRQYWAPQSGTHHFAMIQAALTELNYQTDETNFALGLTYLLEQLKRRSIVIVLTDFVDTVTAQMMIATVGRASSVHLVVFLTLNDLTMRDLVDAELEHPDDLTRAVVAAEIQRDRLVVLDQLRRMGVLVIDAVPEQVDSSLINEYMQIKQSSLL